MLSEQDYGDQASPLLRFANEILALELIWPFPLLAIGVLGIIDPLIIGVVLALALLPWLGRLLLYGRPTRRTAAGGPLVLLVISALAGLWAAYDPRLGWPMLLTLLGSVSLFFAIINTHGSFEPVAKGLVILAVLMALYFVGQYAHFEYEWEAGRLARLGRITGSSMPKLVFFIPHPNAVAAFLEGAFLLSLMLFGRARSGRRLAWGLASLIIAYGLLISGSRGAWVGLAVVMAIGGLLLVRNRGLRLAVGGVGIGLGLPAAYAALRLLPPDLRASAITSALGAAGSRLALYRNSLHLLGDYPFTGIGPGDTFAMVYSRYQLIIHVPFLFYAHNLFLAVWLGYGLLGLAALAWLLFAFYSFVIRVERAGLSQPLFRAAWLGTTVSFVHGLIDSPQFSDSRWTTPMLFAFLGLAVAAGCRALVPAGQGLAPELPKGRYPDRKWMVLAGMAVVLLATAAVYRRPLTSAWYANLGAVYHAQADLSPALEGPALDEATREAAMTTAVSYFERALRLSPGQPTANRRLGMMALEEGDFDAAVSYLERAYIQERGNQATLKLLGYAYLWSGQLDSAEELLRQLDNWSLGELEYWRWWWGTQGRRDLSGYADEMLRRLAGEL